MKSPAASWGSSMEPKPPPPPAFAGAPPPVPLPAANTQGGLVPAKRPTAAKKPPGGGGVPGSGAFGAPAMGNGASSKPFVPFRSEGGQDLEGSGREGGTGILFEGAGDRGREEGGRYGTADDRSREESDMESHRTADGHSFGYALEQSEL